MNTTNWKIAEQSKVKLEKSLLTVMEKYNYKEITITQITQEARLSRKTFYRMFSCKEDVINSYFQRLFKECLDKIKQIEVQHYWEVVQLYFDFWEERRALLVQMKQHSLLTMLFEFTYKHSFEIFEYVHAREAMYSHYELLSYMLAYSIGGMHSMLLKWVENDMDVPSSILIEKLKSGYMSSNI